MESLLAATASYGCRATEKENPVCEEESVLRRNVKIARKLNCNLCEKTFCSTCELDWHMKTHPEVVYFLLQLADIVSAEKDGVFQIPLETDACLQESTDETPETVELIDSGLLLNKCLQESTSAVDEKVASDVHRGSVTVSSPVRKSPRKRGQPSGSDTDANLADSVQVKEEKTGSLSNANQRLTCSFCDKTFGTTNGRILHEKAHNGDFAYRCEQCGKGFNMSSHLKQHLNAHNKVKPFQCWKCNKNFASKQKQKAHEVKCGDPKTQKSTPQYLLEPEEKACKFCGKTYRRSESLRLHMRVQHTKGGRTRYKCERCHRHFAQKSALRVHQKNPNACQRTLIATSCISESTHLKLTTESADLNIESKSVITDAALEAVEDKVNVETAVLLSGDTRETTKQHKCEECRKSFTTVYGLEIHKRQHTDDYPFRCDECGKGFNNNNTLSGHMNKHKDFKPHLCSKCGKAFYHLSNQQRHYRYCDPSKEEERKQRKKHEDQHICPYCGKLLRTAGGLMLHMNKHTENFPFRCTLCNKGYNSSMLLKAHQDSHTNVKAFVCQHCGKTYRHKSNLNRHVSCCDPAKQPMDGTGRFACDLCDKTFLRKESLPEHKMAKHSSVKFQCNVCAKEYDSRGSLFWHKTKSACARGVTPGESRRKPKKEPAPQEPQLQLLQPVINNFPTTNNNQEMLASLSMFDLNQASQQDFVLTAESGIPLEAVVASSSLTLLETLNPSQTVENMDTVQFHTNFDQG